MAVTGRALKSTPRAVQCAAEAMDRWLSRTGHEAEPIDRVIASCLRTHRELNSGERRWVSAAVYGTVRLLNRQMQLLAGVRLETTAQNLMALWLEEHGEAPREQLTAAIAMLPGADYLHGYLRTTLSFSDKMASRLELLAGPLAGAAGEAFNLQAPTMLRVNPLRASVQRAREALPDTKPSHYSPWGLSLPERMNIREAAGFAQGHFELQEEASQLAVLLSNVCPGMKVVDVGAGAGGKTLALAAMMRNRGSLTALDVSEAKLNELRLRAKRAGAAIARTLRVDASSDGAWLPAERLEALNGSADCVFVDVPCSGSGAIRRNPDAKWREWCEPDVCALQLMMLDQASSLVSDGGSLIYVTCAFETYQNEDVVEQFLSGPRGSHFSVEPAEPHLRTAMEAAAGLRDAASEPPDISSLFSGPYMRTWPHLHGMDAFFAARLRKHG